MIKAPSEKRVRNFRWGARLPAGVTIDSFAMAVSGADDALTLAQGVEGPAVNDARDATSCFILGGTINVTYRLTNTVTLSNGEIRTWTITIIVRPYV